MAAGKYIEPPTGSNLFKLIGIPECLHDLMEFAGVQFVFKKSKTLFFAGSEEMEKPTNWILTMPTNLGGQRVEIPINDPIDKDDPEGHWRAIIAAAADFQALVNTGQYNPGV